MSENNRFALDTTDFKNLNLTALYTRKKYKISAYEVYSRS